MKSAYGLATVLALGLGASTMLAAERATFVLTDGERVSGEVVFHTEERTNIRADKNEFNLKVADGTERPIPFSHVVLIDSLGGQARHDAIAVNLTKKQIEDSPSLDSDKPVSRQNEGGFSRYYGFPYYWRSSGL